MSKILGPQVVTSWCNKRLETDPDSLPANYVLAILSRQNGDFDNSLHYTDICLRITKGQETQWLEFMAMKGGILIQSYLKNSSEKSLKGAIGVYEMMLEKQPNNSGIMNNLAYLLVDNNQDIKRAGELAKRAYQMSPNEANKMDTYAYTLIKLKRYKKAEQMLQSAIQLFSKQASLRAGWEVYYHLGMAQNGLGKPDKAKASYMRAIELGGKKASEKDLKKVKDALDGLSGV
jgi:tetratricopeptide (TPR) repeat protein